MPDNGPRFRRRRKRKRSPLFASLSFIIICAAMIFGMGVFFRVSTIEVTGVSTYTVEEVIEASEIEVGDNLFFLNRFSAISKVLAKLKYVDEVQVLRSLPNKVKIVISESNAIAYLRQEGDIWILNRNCKLMEKVDDDATRGLIELTGIELIAPALNEIIALGEKESIKVSYLSDILSEIQVRKLTNDVSTIDMSNAANPVIEFMGRFSAKFGKNENTSHKFERMLGAVAQLSENEVGTIDLSQADKTVFTPT